MGYGYNLYYYAPWHMRVETHYLMAEVDLYSRKVLNWSVSNTMDAEWYTEFFFQTIALNGTIEIFNTDQGSQFTSEIFIKVLNENNIKILMVGKGRVIDNIFGERQWRTVKYENIFLEKFKNGLDLQAGLIEYFDFYNHSQFHESLSNLTPGFVYKNQPSYQHLSYFINKEKRRKKKKKDFYNNKNSLLLYLSKLWGFLYEITLI